MTNFSLSSALRAAIPAAALAIAAAGCAEKDGVGEYASAKAAFESGNYSKALREISAALACEPDSVQALLLASQCNLKTGEIRKAGELLARAEELEPDSADVLFLCAEAAFVAKDYAKARGAYGKIAGSKTASAAVRSRALACLGVVDIMGIDGGAKAELYRASARTRLLEAVRLDGRNAAARYHLGYLYRYSYEYLPLALDQYEIFVRLLPASDARVAKVQRGAIPELKDAIARSAMQRPGADRRDAAYSSSLYKKGEDALKKNQLTNAKKFFLESYNADVLNFGAAVQYAKLCLRLDPKNGQAEALKYYMEACKLRPSSKETLMAAGDLAMKASSFATAVSVYSRAVAVSPNDVAAVDCLVRALKKSGGDGSELAGVYQNYRNSIRAGAARK